MLGVGVTCFGMTAPTPSSYSDPLERVQAYQLAREAGRLARADCERLRDDPLLLDAARQLFRASGSIAANIAEGYVRSTVADRRRFLEYALGSAREACVWYEHINPQDVAERVARLTSIRRLLLTMIRTSREGVARESKFRK